MKTTVASGHSVRTGNKDDGRVRMGNEDDGSITTQRQDGY
jgi:hypothetical protein